MYGPVKNQPELVSSISRTPKRQRSADVKQQPLTRQASPDTAEGVSRYRSDKDQPLVRGVKHQPLSRHAAAVTAENVSRYPTRMSRALKHTFSTPPGTRTLNPRIKSLLWSRPCWFMVVQIEATQRFPCSPEF